MKLKKIFVHAHWSKTIFFLHKSNHLENSNFSAKIQIVGEFMAEKWRFYVQCAYFRHFWVILKRNLNRTPCNLEMPLEFSKWEKRRKWDCIRASPDHLAHHVMFKLKTSTPDILVSLADCWLHFLAVRRIQGFILRTFVTSSDELKHNNHKDLIKPSLHTVPNSQFWSEKLHYPELDFLNKKLYFASVC